MRKWLQARARAYRIKSIRRARISSVQFQEIIQRDPGMLIEDALQLADLIAWQELKRRKIRIRMAYAMLALRWMRRNRQISTKELEKRMCEVREHFAKEMLNV